MSPIESSAAERSLAARMAAHHSWAVTEDRPARTANARNALENKFLAEAGGDPVRAKSVRKAYYARLALKSAQARRRRSSEQATADDLDAQLKAIVDLASPLTRAQRERAAALLAVDGAT